MLAGQDGHLAGQDHSGRCESQLGEPTWEKQNTENWIKMENEQVLTTMWEFH